MKLTAAEALEVKELKLLRAAAELAKAGPSSRSPAARSRTGKNTGSAASPSPPNSTAGPRTRCGAGSPCWPP